MASFFKLIAFLGMLFTGYNVLLVLRSNAQFEGIISFQETRQDIVTKFGEPIEVYGCPSPDSTAATEQHPLCKNAAVEVAVYRVCMIPPVCPDLITITFDKSGKVIYKYKPPKTTVL